MVDLKTSLSAATGDLSRAPNVLVSSQVVVLSDPEGARAEAVRVLRTHLMSQHVTLGRRGLAVCATAPDTGCTLLATNLAVSFAQAGLDTLLIDADLRRPGIDKLLPPAQTGPGLNEYLRDEKVEVSQITSTGLVENLTVIYAGKPSPASEDRLAGERFGSLMEACLREHDIAIIDTPAANSSYDLRRVASVAGYALIVARKNKTLFNDLKVMTHELGVDRARVVGSVLNED